MIKIKCPCGWIQELSQDIYSWLIRQQSTIHCHKCGKAIEFKQYDCEEYVPVNTHSKSYGTCKNPKENFQRICGNRTCKFLSNIKIMK